MDARRSLASGVLAAAMICSLAGCGAPSPEYRASEFVGTWVNDATTLELHRDGTFVLSNAPAYTLYSDDIDWQSDDGETRDGHGTWSMSLDSVELDNVDAHAGEKMFISSGSVDTLFWGIDSGSADPRCFELVRKGSGEKPHGPDQCFSYG